MKRWLLAAVMLAGLANVAIAQTLPKVKIGAVVLTGISPIVVAVDKGYFREEGLDAEIVNFQIPATMPSAVISGDIDFGVSSVGAAFYNLAGKGGVKIVAGVGTERSGFRQLGYFVSTKAYDGGLKTLADLGGHSVGIGAFGSSTQYAVIAAMRKHTIPKEAVRIVQLQSVSNQVAAVKGNQVDMAVLHVGQIPALEQAGVGRTIAWLGEVETTLFTTLYTSPRNILTRRDVVEKAVRALQKGAAEYNRVFNRRDAAGNFQPGPGYEDMMKLLAPRMPPGDPNEMVRALGYADPQIGIDIENVRRQVSGWQDVGMVDKGVTAEAIVDGSFVASLPKISR
jgi:NitT/TauT family transport system substrate-binding protein